MPYFPATLPKEAEPWLVREFQTISQALDEPVQKTAWDVLEVELSKPRVGNQVFAGTNWDPGYGTGPYVYVSGDWLPMFTRPAWAADRIIVACSDETTALTTGLSKRTFRMPVAFTLTEVRASVTTAPTGAAIQVDINVTGTGSILSTKLTIDASEKTSTTAATPAVISTAAIADDAEVTIDIDQVGSTVAGAGLKVYFIGVPG